MLLSKPVLAALLCLPLNHLIADGGVPLEGDLSNSESTAAGGASSGANDPAIQPAKPVAIPFNWAPAMKQSGLFLNIQHAFRLLTEEGTRQELRGPFVRDYGRAVRHIGGWGDGDPFIVNYVGHPMMGAVSGYIQIQNDSHGKRQEFGMNRDYWRSRLKATAWSAAYSLQFELGPVSEASIGNVGKVQGDMGMVDLVMTPVGGLGWQVAEDALDRYVVRWVESKTSLRGVRMVTRSFLNPSRAFSNMLRGKTPWHRDYRTGISVK